MSSFPPPSTPRLGVFDSGVGGLTVLRELRQQLPEVALHYVADAAHAPYGVREPGYIIERSLKVAGHLIDQGARVLVVACNTATAHAIAALRQRWPDPHRWHRARHQACSGAKPRRPHRRDGHTGHHCECALC